MNNNQKFDFLLNYLNISTQKAAKELGVTDAFISQLRSSNNRVIKRMHILAFTCAFEIPMEIFNEEISSTEAIIELLEKKSSSKFVQETQISSSEIEGDFFIYSYALSDILEPLKITLINNEIFLQNSQKKIGYSFSIDSLKTFFVLDYDFKKITLSIDNNFINEKAFYAILEKKVLTQEISSSTALISSKKLSIEDISSLLTPTKEHLYSIDINYNMLNSLKNYLTQKSANKTLKKSKSIYGIWNLYFENKHTILAIDNRNNVFYYKDNALYMKGVLEEKLIHLKNCNNQELYILLESNNYENQQIVYLSPDKNFLNENITVALLSQNPLNSYEISKNLLKAKEFKKANLAKKLKQHNTELAKSTYFLQII